MSRRGPARRKVSLGGPVGLGYGLATPTVGGGMAAPRGLARVRAALLTGLACESRRRRRCEREPYACDRISACRLSTCRTSAARPASVSR